MRTLCVHLGLLLGTGGHMQVRGGPAFPITLHSFSCLVLRTLRLWT